MARRKRVEGPSAAELQALEEGFAAKPSDNPFAVPPIAQVAGETAAAFEPVPAGQRVEAAKDKADAERYRAAERDGRVALEIPIREIVVEELTRDRMKLDREELEELMISIQANGLRLPIEVFELADPGDGERYGLISGFRRIAAIQELFGPDATIRALVRQPRDAAEAFMAMVEENEVRADLSQYERGRIAVLTVAQGTFADVEEAVSRLYQSASKAKRSKIRSFAMVHEELGDMLSFPQALTERSGLRLANALRMGFEERLRAALASGQGTEPETEWALLEPVVEEAEDGARPVRRGGRPRQAAAPRPPKVGEYKLANGAVMVREHDGRDYIIRFKGRLVDADMVDNVMQEVFRLLGPLK